MPYRTELTSPTGVEPVSVSDGTAREWYSPAFALPREPRVPSRWRRVYIVLATLVAAAGLALLVVPALEAGMDEDPALIEGGASVPAAPQPDGWG